MPKTRPWATCRHTVSGGRQRRSRLGDGERDPQRPARPRPPPGARRRDQRRAGASDRARARRRGRASRRCRPGTRAQNGSGSPQPRRRRAGQRPEQDGAGDDRPEPARRRHHDQPRPHQVELLFDGQRPEVAQVPLPLPFARDVDVGEVGGVPRPGGAGQRHVGPDGQAEHQVEGREQPQRPAHVEAADRRRAAGPVAQARAGCG